MDSDSRVGSSRRFGRWPLAAAGVLAAFLALPGGVGRSEAGFVAILAQTTTYLNILIDEWEKYSRILEDHLDKVSGIMQPFSNIHAGVRELTDTRGLRAVWRMADAYRASVSDPRCFDPRAYRGLAHCALQRDFEPPELRQLEMEARFGIADGMYRAEALEQASFGMPSPRSLAEAAFHVLDAYVPAAELRRTRERIERNVDRNRWQVRRMRSLAWRARYGAREFQLWTNDAARRPGADGCAGVAVRHGHPVNAGVGPSDPGLIDQALRADCLGGRDLGGVHSPLEGRGTGQEDDASAAAHLSEAEAGTVQASALAGVTAMASLRAERRAAADAARADRQDRAEAVRRRDVEAQARRLACLESTGSFAWVDAGGACASMADPARTGAGRAAANRDLDLY